MTLISIASAMLARLAGAPAGVVLIAKWSALLGLAWLAHRALAGRNPRWRVLLWRGSIAGVGLVAALAFVPPVVRWPVAPEARPIAGDLPRDEARPRPRPSAPVAAPRPITIVEAGPEDAGEPDPTPRFASAPPAMATGYVAPADRAVVRRPWETGTWLMLAWAIGSIALASRLILAGRRLSAIVRRSAEAPEGVVDEFLDVAALLGGTWGVVVRRSAEVSAPCLARIFRPVILLPDLPGGSFGRDDLRAILAHELAHARGHDLAWNLAAHLASIGLWFHPLAWRIRDAHASACDAVCDAVAADQLGDVKSYARTLARLALNVEGPPPATGLAMARSSDVGRRIEALDRRLYRTPPSRRIVMAAMSLASLMAALIGGLAITRAEPPQAAPQAPEKPATSAEAPKEGGRMEVKAVEAAGGRPLEGVSIFFQGRFDGKLRQGTVVTGKDGKAVVEWPAASKIEYLKLFTTRSKFVPIYKDWTDDKRPIELPGSQEFRYEAGTTIGGIVRDEAGRPIAGAKVSVMAPVAEKENFSHWLGFPVTDAEGRWRLDEAPAVLAGVSVRVEHPDYRPGSAGASRDLDTVAVLAKGLAVKGRVLDLEGRPIAGASAIIGHDIWGSDPPTAKADASGVFTLVNCPEGPSVVTVQAPGFAPELRDVRVGDAGEPVEFRLGPSSTLRVRVVDREGKPVVGAFFAADTWRGHRSIRFRADTDAEGRIVWKDAPKDVVLCDMGIRGFMARRHLPLTASDAEQTITLDPELVISGRVTESSTGRPIPEFRIVQGRRFEGQERTYWSRGEGPAFVDGQYSIKLSEPSAAYFVLV
jgi:beta-lactamase regulating signal transducer with metallopeptidase domain